MSDNTEAQERAAFEADAERYDFDLRRQQLAVPEPWSQYRDADTGHRWAGWLARAALAQQAATPTDTHDALRRLWPIIEMALDGLVFTADKAGEVAADVATVRAALAQQAATTAPAEPYTHPENERERKVWASGWRDGFAAGQAAPPATPAAQPAETVREWTIFNGGGAVVAEGVTSEDAADCLTDERAARGWVAVHTIVARSAREIAAPPATPAPAEPVSVHPQSLRGLVESCGGNYLTGGGAAFTSAALAKFVVATAEAAVDDYALTAAPPATPAAQPAEPTVEALEYLFLAIATNADSDYRFRALRRAEVALEKAMPGWTSPVPPLAAPPAAQAGDALPPTDEAEVLAGWKLNHIQFDRSRKGIAQIGYLDAEDDRFSPVVTVDTGLYYRPDDAVPLARAILDALAAAPAAPKGGAA